MTNNPWDKMGETPDIERLCRQLEKLTDEVRGIHNEIGSGFALFFILGVIALLTRHC